MNAHKLAKRAAQISKRLSQTTVAEPISVTNLQIVPKAQKKDKKMANELAIAVRRSGYDTSKGFVKVTVEKAANFTAPSTIEEAQAALNGDTAKLMEVVVAGMRSIFRDQLESDSTKPWFNVADGKITETQFTGTLLDGPAYDSFTAQVLNLAKTSARPFGSWDSKTSEEKSALKVKARNAILANPAIFGFDFSAVSEADAARIEE